MNATAVAPRRVSKPSENTLRQRRGVVNSRLVDEAMRALTLNRTPVRVERVTAPEACRSGATSPRRDPQSVAPWVLAQSARRRLRVIIQASL
jgi:hypothetical protein